MTDPRPVMIARDALAITRATLTGDIDGASEVIAGLDPMDVPATIGALVSLVHAALGTAPDVPVEVFLDACRHSIDAADVEGG